MPSDAGDSETEDWEPPPYQSEWDEEFKESTFNPRKMQLVCLISAVYFIGHFFGTVFVRENDDVGGGWRWLLATWLPEIICAAQNLLWMLALETKSLRPLCIQYYSAVCTYIIITSYGATIIPAFIWEYRLLRFHGLHPSKLWLTIDFSSFPPNRTCTVVNDVHATDFVASCNTAVLSGTSFIGYVFWNLLPRVCRVKPALAALVALSTTTMLLFFSLAIGADTWTIVTCVVFQFMAGIGTAAFCVVGEKLSREKFAILKSTQFTGTQNRDLLYTLIPPNVVANITDHDPAIMLGREIPHCIIMFCSLEPHADLRASEAALALLDSIFSAFDEAVARHSIFKYQHVGDWYIVACPRAANPFDTEEQAGAPDRYVRSIVLLGLELQSIAATNFRSLSGAELWLRVGIACGPAAGAVIGTLRSFYCIYGDTVNTAARMCKYSTPSQIHCTKEFAAMVNPASCMVRVDDRGVNEIKGKGLMRTYNLVPEATSRRLGMVQLVMVHSQQNEQLDDQQHAPTNLREIVQTSAGQAHAEQWLANPARAIDLATATFKEGPLETQFQRLMMPGHRRLLTAGLLLHALCIPLQWRLAGAGDNPPPDTWAFAQLRSPEDKQFARDLLSIHWIVCWVVSLCLLGGLWSDVVYTHLMSAGFLLLLIGHLVVQAVASNYMALGGDPWSWALTLGTGVCLICGWLGPTSIYSASALSICAAAAFYAALPPRAAYATEAAMILALAIGLVLLVWFNNRDQRVRFLLRELCKAQLTHLRGILHDLLPPSIARTMIRISARPRPESCRAAVLQLDICKFTVLSQTIPPLELASLIHKLFLQFDAEVQRQKLFKMDTIGDAYIVAGLLPDTHGQSATQRVCHGLVEVARVMIQTLQEHSRETGQEVSCRIGVAVGTVVTGVLGKLQPRFHIQGPGVHVAENLESSSPLQNALHASESFLRAALPEGEEVSRSVVAPRC